MSSDLRSIPGGERLIVVVGPSGAGKDSVLRGWRAAFGADAPGFAQRVITRAPDSSEAHEAVTPDDFAGCARKASSPRGGTRMGSTMACVGASSRRWPAGAGSC